MENKIFEQMQKIVKEYNGKTRILLISDSDRGIGKTYNLKLVAQAYGCRVANKYSLGSNSVYLPADERLLAGRRKKDSDIFILDEGYSLDEIALLKKYFHIPFALLNAKNFDFGVEILGLDV